MSTTKPLFRDIEAGEQRVEGTLERIVCPAGAPVVFHVRTATGADTFQAAKFEAVDFITYRDDLSGALTCGPLKEPMPVYVTWRQGTAPLARQAVAIEFLPK